MQRVASYNPGAPAAAMITPSIAENTVFDGASSISLHKSGISSPVHRKVAHNAIERRYRNNINDRICDLRNSVPALQSIRPKSSKQNQAPGGLDTNNNDENENDDEVDDENENEEAVVIDGVVAATKLNKATILGKSTEYIYHLRRSNDLYKRESLYLQQMIRKMSDGDKIDTAVVVGEKPATQTSRTTISKQPFYYFAISMVTDSPTTVESQQYYDYIMVVLRQWLGAIGAGMSVDIVDLDYPKAIIRVPFDKYKSVWQAMTVTPFKQLDGTNAHFQVLHGSAFAMGVVSSSRD
ncbi:hypothetical protein EV175_003194 [Coemansia sp. RSA 1933]|nr:hypothetical protein EV175_003194 [Coemansia sp. RSA 1933]